MKHNGEGVAVARWMAECRPWDGDEPVRAEALAPGVLPLKHPLIFALEIKGFRRDILLGLSDFGSP